MAVNATVDGGTLTDDSARGTIGTGIEIGQWISVREVTGVGAPVSGNVQIYKVKSKTANTLTFAVATQVGTTETTKTVKVAASMIRAPRNGETAYMKRHKYFFERQHGDVDPAQFFAFGGNLVNSWSVNGASASLLTGSFDFMGETASVCNDNTYDTDTNPNGNGVGSLATLDGAGFTAADTFNGFNAVSHIKGIYLDGVNVNKSAGGDIYIQSLDFTLANNLRGVQAMGYMGNIAVQAGQLGVTGNIASYFANDKMYRRFIDGDEFSLEYVVENEAGDGYVFSFPRVTISTSGMNAGGNDQDLIENMQWTALYDSTLMTSMQVDRLYTSY